ncbi:S-adenosyl-L-methionine-dependent methyltransferase [Violaceomyces palustris]|uniref:S-adenosyl-L-methionine-dependent methyltransferase n=1 Tax=Violaceomyces palustris TaxID=1673888 RepID=A0ACD0P2N4_9BASI|nr:S-adenosyl-L-methionine-dependent methyltransferase [Violaceomyces palustris]
MTVAIGSNNVEIISGLSGVPGTEQRFYHSDEKSIYALPTDSDEFDRLEKQHRLILHLFNGPISSPEVKHRLESGEPLKILDVGCGPGSWAKQVAKEFPNAIVHATDFVECFKPEEKVEVDFDQGNVLSSLPYQDGTFDLVHMRFFTGALKKQEWEVATREILRVTKSGGWVQMVEPDGELRSQSEEVSEILNDWNRRGMRGSLEKRGGDPLAGIRLETFLRSAGSGSVRILTRSAPMAERYQGDELGALMKHDYLSLVSTLAPVLCITWGISSEEMVEWGSKVVKECERLKAFHNFVTAVAQKP